MASPEIPPNAITPYLRPVTRNGYQNELTRRYTGEYLSDTQLDAISGGVFLDDPGDGLTTNGFRHARTIRGLRGSERSLNDTTYIRYETFVVPEVVTKENVEHFIYKREIPKVAFTLITINEPGNFYSRVKTDVSHYYMHEIASHPITPVAVGIAKYLNGTLGKSEQLGDQLDEALRRTYGLIHEIKNGEEDYINSFLDTIGLNSPN